MSKSYEFKRFDFDAVWEAIGRSTAMRDTVAKVASEVQREAEANAYRDAFDEGYYKNEFDSGASSGAEVRRLFLGKAGTRRNRARRGQTGTNRLLEGTAEIVSGDAQGSGYGGAVGYVINADFKALWIEYGSIAKGPKFVLTKAAEAVAVRRRAAFERLYAKTHEQNRSELGRRISAGKTRR